MDDNILNKKIPRLFKRALNTLNDKEDNSKITEEYISIVNRNIIENEIYLNEAQNVVLSKIMLYLIIFCNNKTPSENLKEWKEFYEKKLESNIEKVNIFEEIKKEKETSLEKIILAILKYFLKNLREKQNAKDLKKKWEDLHLHLENFEINNTINEALFSYLEKLQKNPVNFCKELEELLISELKLGNNSKIIKNIYYFINFKIKEEDQIIYMKDLADKERENNEYIIKINKNNINTNDNKMLGNKEKEIKVPEDYLINLFKQWSIEIDLNEENINPLIVFGYGEQTDKYYEDYNDKNKEYNKKFKGYIEFKNKVMKYIEEVKKNIKLKTKITLIITPIKEDKKPINDDKYFYECKEIQCKSSYEHRGQKFECKDTNILENGINGDSPGFIFLINELCNDEYINEI